MGGIIENAELDNSTSPAPSTTSTAKVPVFSWGGAMDTIASFCAKSSVSRNY